MATTIGEGNVRYGPGLEYPIIVEVPAGSSFRIMERHAIVPWVRIELPDSPTGSGWIYNEVIEVSGDIYSVPVTENLQFDLPDLTPTPQIVLANGAPWDGAPVASGQLANTLGQQVYTYLTAQGFIPFTHKFGSVFVMDLKTGDRFTINGGIAFSGMSLTKIGILITYFARHEGPFTDDEAYLVADTMMCSENITTNRLLDQIGDGDMLRGAQRVTARCNRSICAGRLSPGSMWFQTMIRPFTPRPSTPASIRSAPGPISIMKSCPKISAGCWAEFTSVRWMEPGC